MAWTKFRSKMASKFQKKRQRTLKGKVETLSKKVRQVMTSMETKYSDNTAINITPDDNGSTGLTPYRGVDDAVTDLNSRVGDKITIKSYTIRGFMYMNTGSIDTGVLRIVAFIYKGSPDAQNNGIQTVVNQFLDGTTSNTGYFPYSFKDWDNRSNYVVVYDKTHVIQPTVAVSAGTTAGVMKKVWNINIKIPKRYQNIQYSAGTTNPIRNDLYVAFISDGTSGMGYSGQSRLTYTDA